MRRKGCTARDCIGCAASDAPLYVSAAGCAAKDAPLDYMSAAGCAAEDAPLGSSGALDAPRGIRRWLGMGCAARDAPLSGCAAKDAPLRPSSRAYASAW